MSQSKENFKTLFGKFNNYEYEELLEVLHKYDDRDHFKKNASVEERDFEKDFNDDIDFPNTQERAVLGINIFCQYSFHHQSAEGVSKTGTYNKVRMSLGNLNTTGLISRMCREG